MIEAANIHDWMRIAVGATVHTLCVCLFWIESSNVKKVQLQHTHKHTNKCSLYIDLVIVVLKYINNRTAYLNWVEMWIKVIAWTATSTIGSICNEIFFTSIVPFNRHLIALDRSIDMKQNTHIFYIICMYIYRERIMKEFCGFSDGMTTSSHSHFHSLFFLELSVNLSIS